MLQSRETRPPAGWSLTADDSSAGATLRLWERPGPHPGAPRIALVHGFEENWDSWLPLAAHLWSGLHLYALELPWRAGSAHTWGHHGSPAAWLERALTGLPVPPDAVVAHSFGATTLLESLALRSAAASVPAVLVAPVYRPHDDPADPAFYAEALARFRRVLADGMRVQIGPRAATLPEDLLDIMARKIRERVEPQGFLQFYAQLVRTAALDPGRVDVPVLFIGGTGDQAAPPAAVDELRARMTDLRVHQSPDLTHFCQTEQSQEVAARIDGFLAGLGQAPTELEAIGA
ncbi:alpha/beta fold hydrolase [Streptomyces sp. CA-135486]|uniref:alpha/beta fold hydrolase n=1 Tax=Streptomyces sp. CA-135486 TaxID=3240049 RepID=UPI003D91CB8D